MSISSTANQAQSFTLQAMGTAGCGDIRKTERGSTHPALLIKRPHLIDMKPSSSDSQLTAVTAGKGVTGMQNKRRH